MKEFYDFAGSHPILTFFLFLIIGEVIFESIRAIAGIFKKDKTK